MKRSQIYTWLNRVYYAAFVAAGIGLFITGKPLAAGLVLITMFFQIRMDWLENRVHFLEQRMDQQLNVHRASHRFTSAVADTLRLLFNHAKDSTVTCDDSEGLKIPRIPFPPLTQEQKEKGISGEEAVQRYGQPKPASDKTDV